jgi:hypothetical protein
MSVRLKQYSYIYLDEIEDNIEKRKELLKIYFNRNFDEFYIDIFSKKTVFNILKKN